MVNKYNSWTEVVDAINSKNTLAVAKLAELGIKPISLNNRLRHYSACFQANSTFEVYVKPQELDFKTVHFHGVVNTNLAGTEIMLKNEYPAQGLVVKSAVRFPDITLAARVLEMPPKTRSRVAMVVAKEYRDIVLNGIICGSVNEFIKGNLNKYIKLLGSKHPRITSERNFIEETKAWERFIMRC